MSMAVEMSSKQPTKDFFSSPALSLSLAGIFRNASSGNTDPAEEDFLSRRVVDDEDRTVEMSSENSGPTRSRSEEDLEGEDHEEDLEDDDGNKGNKRKRKKYHRHTTDQIRHMEALFKETPHPDEKQRQQLSKQLGLAPRQVKFWFQNRRTQIKAIQERHENSLLKAELEKLREENKAMRESFSKAANSSCPNCGGGPDDLHLENSKLKAELDKLRAALGRTPYPLQASCSEDQEQRLGSLDFYTGVFALEKSRIAEIANRATLELQKMATSGEPLWLRSVETGREILNYDEYLKEFPQAQASSFPGRKTIEASRDVGIVFMDAHKLAQSFMDVGQWKEMFACLVSKAATVDVIRQGEGPSRIDGAIQLMFGEMQLLTPVVPTREVYFVRSCRQLTPEKWAIVDVSVSVEDSNTEKEASLLKCRKLPSGCIIEDTSNGHSKVTWVEHLDVSASTVHPLFRSLVNTGLAFGARHWVATLQLHCERLVFFMATNVPTKDSLGVTTLAGRKSVLKMAQRMTQSFYRAIAASSYHQWTKITTKTGQDMRVSSRKNLHDPGEPTGVIVCASSSLWLPVSPTLLFDFFRDEARRHEWDALSNGAHVQSIASLSKGQDRGNSVAIQTVKSREKSIWVLQDSSTNSYESVVVYAPVDINTTQLVLAGHDPSNIQILPCGFSIIPDGVESRPLVITTTQDDRNSQGGSLLTLALQTLINPSPAAKLNMESVDSVTNLVSVTLHNIRRSLQIEDC
ncbi:PREDICTED: homeobox-leucine zipper protein GLABRA 2-like [Camelina sativa]|uniref:Homeobox-leucine zipper protein GLABRA 2-like n=1 Tax=Camelina sativa TaxID=90675 RepID=A0ABM0TR93_CAMSA|nr:PREDICTED: homeobox-leucine zipper protein GLABRA 2-like [Camelina sativa]